MTKLITTTPVGRNGQTVVPAQIRKMFKLHSRCTRVGWFIHDHRIEVAPMEERKAGYSLKDLDFKNLIELFKRWGKAN